MAIESRPPNVNFRSVPPTISASRLRRARCAPPISTVVLPYAFESRTRTVSLPTLVCTISRSVWFSNTRPAPRISASPASCGAGLAPQVTTHCLCAIAAEASSGISAANLTIRIVFTCISYRNSYRGAVCRYRLRDTLLRVLNRFRGNPFRRPSLARLGK
jgi:hypothetical protein